MSWLVGLFVMGSIGFWVLMIFMTCWLIAMVDYERPGLATFSLGVTFLLLGFFGNFNVLTTAQAYPLLSVLCIVGYFVAGILWAFAKWWFFLRDAREKYDEARSEFLKSHDVEDVRVPDNLLKDWQTKANFLIAPRAKNNKARILTWMMYWPWSLVWTVLNDPVKRAFKAIYNKVQAVFQKMADDAFADVAHDFRNAPELPRKTEDVEDHTPHGFQNRP